MEYMAASSGSGKMCVLWVLLGFLTACLGAAGAFFILALLFVVLTTESLDSLGPAVDRGGILGSLAAGGFVILGLPTTESLDSLEPTVDGGGMLGSLEPIVDGGGMLGSLAAGGLVILGLPTTESLDSLGPTVDRGGLTVRVVETLLGM